MPNTITGLMPDLYEAMDVVSRELVGMIPAVTRDHEVARAAIGQTVRSPVAPASVASNITPGVTPPNDGDQTIGNVTMAITKARRVPVRWSGEEQLGLSHGPGVRNIRRDQFAQAMRALTNEIELDLCALYIRASRSTSEPGTALFATNLSDPAQALKILADNGCPKSDLQMVIGTAAGANMRTLANLTKASEAGSTDMLRRGVLLDIHGFAIRESAQVRMHTSGTGASYVTGTMTAPVGTVGSTTVPLVTGTGTILAGDSVRFAGDPNTYIVATGISAPGTMTLAAPGLRRPLAAGVTCTVVAQAGIAQSMAFDRGAIALATRMPALPEEGDMADDRTTITDPVSGLSFEVALYRQYRQVQYEVSVAWGVQCFKPEHFALLLG